MNKISINEVLGTILLELPRDLTTQEKFKVRNYINRVVKMLAVHKTFDIRNDEIPITNRRGILPDNLITLIGVFADNLQNDNCDCCEIRLRQAYNDRGYVRNDQYIIQGNIIIVGDKDLSKVIIRYSTPEVDCNGYWMIPDNEHIIEAIKWFVIKTLIGAGMTGFPYNHQYATEMFEKIYAPRAIESVKQFTPEDAERLLQNSTKLIWNFDIWESHGDFGQKEKLRFNDDGLYKVQY